MAFPELFGTYVLHHQLAHSDTSDVYLAQTTGDFPRPCALKRIRLELATVEDFSAQFRADAAFIVRLLHGNLVQVLEVGAVDRQLFLAMELVEGVTPGEIVSSIPSSGDLPVEAALYVGLELCEAVSYIRQQRDIQDRGRAQSYAAAWSLDPLLSFDGAIKIIDLGSYGALRLRRNWKAELHCSPGYSAPEVIGQRTVDGRTDVFAVGKVLWELLVGKPLFGFSPEAYVQAVRGEQFQAPAVERRDLPGDVIRTVASMLVVSPDRRAKTLEQPRQSLVAALRRIAPTFGAADFARLLRQRFPERVGQAERLLDELPQKSPRPRRASATRTFSRAGSVTRKVKKPVALRAGDRIPGTRYRLVRLLGTGGSAEVFAAQHIDLDRQVALKILSSELATRADAIAQFRLEARVCSRIGHPNIVDVIDFGELEDGRFFFAMELLEGESLADILARERRLSVERTLGIFRQIAKALHAAHKQGIIHRDLKPENVILGKRTDRRSSGSSVPKERHDFVKVLDFGVMAFAADANAERVGTPGYIAPGQAQGMMPAPQMDIYSIGATMYEVLCGTLPFPGATVDTFLQQQAAGPAPALRSQPHGRHVPPSIERVVHRALEYDSTARHPSAADFEADLIRAQQVAGIVTPWDDLPPPEGVYDDRPDEAKTRVFEALPPPKRAHSHGATVSRLRGPLIAGAFLMLAATMGVTWWLTRDTGRRAGALSDNGAYVEAGTLPPAFFALLAQADAAARAGKFTYPEGDSAFDLLLKADLAWPNNGRTGGRRKMYARWLEAAAEPLAKAGLRESTRTLYREALLFEPQSERLRRLAYPKHPRRGQPARPTPRLAEIAHLVALVQKSVGRGDFLSPPKHNALFYLRRLRQLVKRTRTPPAELRTLLVKLQEQAQSLSAGGDRRLATLLAMQIAEFGLPEVGGLPGSEAPPNAMARTSSEGFASDAAAAQPKAVGSGDSLKRARTTKRAGASGRSRRTEARQKSQQGLAMLRTGQLLEASQRFRAAVKLNARSYVAIAGLAAVAFQQAQYEKAVGLARRALAINARYVKAHIVLGDSLFRLMRRGEAKAAWRAALRIDPRNRIAKGRLARVQ